MQKISVCINEAIYPGISEWKWAEKTLLQFRKTDLDQSQPDKENYTVMLVPVIWKAMETTY